ncbi:MAG: hypothetical protein SFY69_13375 [Planctomycetota bacterium]|nr:hypothetical protein [Planctomycetota bacterium]
MDYFPTTRFTWIDEELGRGEAGRASLNAFLMDVYAEPLKAYFLGSSARFSGMDADDAINGLFAACLGRPTFVAEWRASGMRLRRWLMNALWLHLRTLRTAQRREAWRTGPLDALPTEPPAAERSLMEIKFVQSLVGSAMERTRRRYETLDMPSHWDAFVAFRVRGESCESIAARLGKSPGQTRVMIRGVGAHFAQAVRDTLARDGAAPDEIDAEIQQLLSRTS